MKQAVHDDKEIAGFFNQWDIYQHVVEQDYMSHASIAKALKHVIAETSLHAIKVLDVGCGDAAMVSQVLASFRVQHYVGVDLSITALEHAAEHLGSENIAYELLQGDLSGFPKPSDENSYDFILAGFSLHHLLEDDKQSFYQRCAHGLKEEGSLVIWDVIKRDGESRAAYLDRYCHMVEAWGRTMPKSALHQIERHVRGNDYPQSYDDISHMADLAGFKHVERVFTDVSGFHSLLVLS